MVSSDAIWTIANLEGCQSIAFEEKINENITLIAGTPNRSTGCVYQNPTPAVRRIASSVVSAATTSSISAFAKSEGGMIQYSGVIE